MTSLNAYTERRKHDRYGCVACERIHATLQDEILKARAGELPPSYDTIAAWLKAEHDIHLSPATVRRHLMTCFSDRLS